MEKSKYFRIYRNDTEINILAKQIAFVSTHAIHNPFHCFLEDGNFTEDLSFANKFNEKYRKANGEVLYELSKDFIENYMKLSPEEKREVFRESDRKWNYFSSKISNKLRALGGIEKGKSFCYRHYLEDEQIIYEIKNRETGERCRIAAW